MANFTTADIKRLREITAAGMLDTKKALQEADGDFDKAVDILRVKGAKDVTKRQERTAANGLVTARLDGTASGVLLELDCETDFVAKNERFVELAERIVGAVVASSPAGVEELLAADAGDGTTVADAVNEASAGLGEKFELRRFAQFGGDGGYVTAYLHKTDPALPPQVGVLVELDTEHADVAKDLAQHIAAMSPRFLHRDEVDADTVEKERSLAEQMTREEGKPEQAIPKIVEGRLNAFYKDVVLLEQAFVKDNKKQIKTLLSEAGVGLRRFARFRVGQA